MNTRLGGTARVNDIKGHPQGALGGRTNLVNITEDVGKNAAEYAIDESFAIEHGMKDKSEEFQHMRPEIYFQPRAS